MAYKDNLDILTRTYAQAAAIIRADSPMFDVHKLEVWYGGILEHLSTQSAPVPVTDLVTALRRPKASMTKATDRLEVAGYITKTRNPDDGRSVLVQITPSGRIALNLFHKACRKAEERLFKGVNKEAVLQNLDRMERNVK